MNKCKINFLVVALVLLVPCLAFALPGAHDPAAGLVPACDSCHVPPTTFGNTDARYSTNVCFNCHSNTASITGITQKIFTAEDYSNPFGTTGLARSNKPLQSSHKWFGPDVVPAAGALAPIDTDPNGLNKSAAFQGTLFCARCHNVHGTSGAQSTNSPYLRYPNDSDQLCLNCHRSRDTQDHTQGTHPVNVVYSSAKIASGDLLRSPVSNPTNPTGVVKLINGKIVCSTCHRMHNTDSKTSTFDPYSTTQTFGNLSSSKGYLLRVDPISKDGVNGLNICINCHANRKNHNLNNRLSKAPVQCVDCHSGHVEYDPATPGAPNVNLVRRYLVYTTAGRLSKKIIYRSTTNANRFYDASGTGVCQSCHRPPADHYTGGTYTAVFTPDGVHSTCTDCHSHKNTVGSFSYGADPGSCTNTCHGLPPKTSSGLNGPAAGYTRFDEATSPHVSHAAGGGANVNDFDCTECHNTGYSMDNVVVGEIFKSPAGKIAAKNGANPTYISASATCQNVYCHSNGNNVWKTGMNNIQWGSNKYGTIVGQPTECITCHDDPNSSASHSKHVLTGTGMGYGCITCHAATVTNNTTLTVSAKLVGGTHVNGTKDMAYSGVGAAVDRVSGVASGATCANIACHTDGKGTPANITPSWGSAASGACGACHWTNTTATKLNTGAHSKHFGILLTQTGTTAPASVCAACHTYTTEIASSHVNGTLQVTSGCSSCHTDPYGGASNAPTWYSLSSGCSACHTGSGAFTGVNAEPVTGSHAKHMARPAALCNQCHAGAVANSAGGTFHTDGNIDVTGTAFTGYPVNVTKHIIGSYTGTCSTNCHSVTNANVTTITWGVTSSCVSCHTGTGAFTVNNGPATGSHSKHTAAALGVTCASCHTGAVALSSGGTGHFDNGINVAVTGYPANTAKHAAGAFGVSTCVTACHSATDVANTTPTWGASASCVTCHGVATPVTGSHTSHTSISTCTQCHTGTVAGTTAPTGTHFNGYVDVTNNGYPANVVRHATTTYGAAATCSTSSCHGTLSPVWGVTTANNSCTKCHGTGTVSVTVSNRYVVAPTLPVGTDLGSVSSNAKTGAHQTHLRMFNGFSNYSTIDYRCEACHGTLPTAGTYTHANGTSSPQGKFQNLASKWGAMSPSFVAGTATCANTYCHNPSGTGGKLRSANTGTNVAPSWTNSAYIADGTRKTLTNCNTCHKVPGESGFSSANAHLNVTIANGCVGCHGHEGDTQGAVGRRHMDGILYGSGNACNDCHGYPPLSPADFAAKGANFVNASVESYPGGGGHHATHLLGTITIADNFTPCLPCHPSSGHWIDPSGSVSKANVRVMDASNEAPSRFDSTRATRYNYSTMKCSNISCHFQPTSAW